MEYIRNDEQGIADRETFEAVCRAVSDSRFLPAGDKIDVAEASRCDSLELRRGASSVGDLDFLRYFKNLRHLTVQSDRLKSIGAVSQLHELESLFVEGASIDKLEALSKCKGLTRLTLANIRVHDGDFSPLRRLTQLETLEIPGCGITDIQWITGHPSLESMQLDDNPLADFAPLRTLPQLESVGYMGRTYEPPFDSLIKS